MASDYVLIPFGLALGVYLSMSVRVTQGLPDRLQAFQPSVKVKSLSCV